MRDFYDVYLIYTKDWKNINKEYLREAIDKTFLKREYKGNTIDAIDIIRNSELLVARWKNYQRKYEYAKGIDLGKILDCIEKMIEQVELVVV